MGLGIRSLGQDNQQPTVFTPQQNRAVLIAGLTCACFSVLVTLITLRWFVLMKRTFRHKLIMFLIFSDNFKAFWYFVFPVVVFSRGPIQSSSGFCQASGFLLAVGVEASDFAILMIALHSILYIMRPPATSAESGGLWRWRRYIYPLWIILPILAASLAFVNHNAAYQTAGTFCYLPRRPFWYRLALSWIPRYCILSLILCMYTGLYVYVTLKFRSFHALQDSDSSYSTQPNSRRSSMSDDGIEADEPAQSSEGAKKSGLPLPESAQSALHSRADETPQERHPWDQVAFITTRPLRDLGPWPGAIQAADFAPYAQGTTDLNLSLTSHARAGSDNLDPLVAADPEGSNRWTDDRRVPAEAVASPEVATPAKAKQASTPSQAKLNDPLQRMRKAIRKQLRYLFIYPAVYVLMWIFPFVSHCLLYDDDYVTHPFYWLTIVQTCSVSLQAAADCMVFSWREKPWRRVPGKHRRWLENFSSTFAASRNASASRSAISSITMGGDVEGGTNAQVVHGNASGTSTRVTSAHWWEAEGKKRKDSVWMGTDSNTHDQIDGRRETLARLNESTPTVVEANDERAS